MHGNHSIPVTKYTDTQSFLRMFPNHGRMPYITFVRQEILLRP